MQQFRQQMCMVHQEAIVQKDNNDKDQCLTCIVNQLQNEIINVKETIKAYQKLADNQQSNEDKENILKAIEEIKQYEIKLTNDLNQKKVKYFNQKFRLIKQYLKNYHYSFCFNQDSTLLFAGGIEYIKLFKFRNGKKLLQTLTKDTHYVYNLIFMNKSNQLVSGGDNSIIIWNQDKNSNWKPYQTLESHVITIMINSEDEDLLISGSNDETIKFWRKIHMDWIWQQTLETKYYVTSLSLNQQQNKLISCGDGSNEILVIELNPEQKQWNITQTIQVNCDGRQLCFISDFQFVFQGKQELLEIYQYQQYERQFIKVKQIEVQKVQWKYRACYPCKYLKSKEILIIKNGNFLNYFGTDENQIFSLKQSLEFSNDLYFGNISNDGQFLVIQHYNGVLRA